MDEEEFVVSLGADAADAGGLAVCVGAGASVFAGVVEGVDGGDLAGAGGAGECEVGVAAGLAEDGEFVGYAAGESFGVGVVERPVTVDKAVADFAVGIAGEEADAGEAFFSLDEDTAEVVRSVVAMVEVDFGFAAGGVAELRECAANVGIPLLDGVEEGVAGRGAGAVAILGGDFGELGLPMRDASKGGGFIGVVERLEVVAHCDEDMALGWHCGALACKPCGEPAVESFLYQVAGCFMRRCARSGRAFGEEDDGGCEVAHAGDGEEERVQFAQG